MVTNVLISKVLVDNYQKYFYYRDIIPIRERLIWLDLIAFDDNLL
jgi:hypothetical protein